MSTRRGSRGHCARSSRLRLAPSRSSIRRGLRRVWNSREGFLSYPKGSITGDFNLLPMLSLLTGTRSRDSLARSVRRYAGCDIDMEDTWKPFFVMAADFSHGREVVLDHGPLVRNVSASYAIPGVVPPILMNGNLMFDGSTFNNLPVDVMARMGVGRIIGVDVTGEATRPLDVEHVPGTLSLLWDRLRPQAQQRYRRLPTMPETVMMSTFITSIPANASSAATQTCSSTPASRAWISSTGTASTMRSQRGDHMPPGC
jgi:predicted acylesterase/phospholipase RssA